MTLYSLTKAAARLGIRRSRLSGWIKDGRVKPIYLDEQIKISVHELERIERHGVPPKEKKRRAPRTLVIEPDGDIMDIEI